MSFTVVIASDHGGFRLKQHVIEHLRSLGVVVQDLGPESSVRCDYPDYANLVCTAVQSAPESTLGVLVCGTGIGMSMTANKHAGIRAAVVSDAFSAKATREHNDCNVLCLGERVVGPGLACTLVETWLTAEFEGGRHQNRLDKMMAFDNRHS